MTTAKRTLIEDRFGADLGQYIRELREDGASWTYIARRIERRTAVPVNRQTLINWFSESTKETA